MEILGGCLCGGTRFVVTAEPFDVGNCHCVDCRRGSAAAFVTWGSVRTSALKMTSGELRKIPVAGRVRSFASCCGTPLFFEDTPGTDVIDLTIASLDNPRAFPPMKDIWTEDKLPWVQLDSLLPSFAKSRKKKT